MDPTGFEPVSLLVKGSMLTGLTLRAPISPYSSKKYNKKLLEKPAGFL